MKTMKNFAAQHLTKKQMNEVKGGSNCIAYDNSGAEIGRGSFPGSHVAEARVKMEISLNEHGWQAGDYTVNCA